MRSVEVWELMTGIFGGGGTGWKGVISQRCTNIYIKTDVLQQAIVNMVKIINSEIGYCLEIQQVCCSDK
jgi:hypothetical protein